jgi:hypothetical protein
VGERLFHFQSNRNKGMLERRGKIRAAGIEDTKLNTLIPNVL